MASNDYMKMAQRPLSALESSRKHLIAGVTTSLVTFALAAYGLSLRAPYTSTAVADIGGVVSPGDGGRARFSPFDGANEVEYFFSNEVFAKTPELGARCTASSMYSPDGGRIRLSCKANTAEEAREVIRSALEPLLKRHERQYQITSAIEADRKEMLERQSQAYKEMLAVLSGSPSSPLVKVQIIENQLRIAGLRERQILDEMLGDRVKKTQLSAEGVTVTDRRPGAKVWAAVVMLSLFAGFLVGGFSWLLRRLGHEFARNDS